MQQNWGETECNESQAMYWGMLLMIAIHSVVSTYNVNWKP